MCCCGSTCSCQLIEHIASGFAISDIHWYLEIGPDRNIYRNWHILGIMIFPSPQVLMVKCLPTVIFRVQQRKEPIWFIYMSIYIYICMLGIYGSYIIYHIYIYVYKIYYEGLAHVVMEAEESHSHFFASWWYNSSPNLKAQEPGGPISNGRRSWRSQLKQRTYFLFLPLFVLFWPSTDWICPSKL